MQTLSLHQRAMGGVWKERSEGGQGVMGLTLGHLHSLPPGYWKVFEEKKNSEQVKNRWMSLVNMQRNKVKKLQILCYFVTVSLVFKYVYFYSYTINSYSIVP